MDLLNDRGEGGGGSMGWGVSDTFGEGGGGGGGLGGAWDGGGRGGTGGGGGDGSTNNSGAGIGGHVPVNHDDDDATGGSGAVGGGFSLSLEDYALLERAGTMGNMDDLLGPIADDANDAPYGGWGAAGSLGDDPSGLGGGSSGGLAKSQQAAFAQAQAQAQAQAMQQAMRNSGMGRAPGGVKMEPGTAGMMAGGPGGPGGPGGHAVKIEPGGGGVGPGGPGGGGPYVGGPGGPGGPFAYDARHGMPAGAHGAPPGGPGSGGPGGGGPGAPVQGPNGMLYFPGPGGMGPLPVLHLPHGGGNKPPSRLERLRRWKEKRKNRNFNKTIRYQSRKVCADNRPRVKGKFVKVGSTPDLGALVDMAASDDEDGGGGGGGFKRVESLSGLDAVDEDQVSGEGSASQGTAPGTLARTTGLRRNGGLTAAMSVPDLRNLATRDNSG